MWATLAYFDKFDAFVNTYHLEVGMEILCYMNRLEKFLLYLNIAPLLSAPPCQYMFIKDIFIKSNKLFQVNQKIIASHFSIKKERLRGVLHPHHKFLPTLPIPEVKFDNIILLFLTDVCHLYRKNEQKFPGGDVSQ